MSSNHQVHGNYVNADLEIRMSVNWEHNIRVHKMLMDTNIVTVKMFGCLKYLTIFVCGNYRFIHR